MREKPTKKLNSRFFKQFLNNRFVIFLFIVLLISLIVLVLSQLSHLFFPIQIAVNIIAAPIIFSAIFFYLMNPLVDWLEKKKISRNAGFFLIVILVGILLFLTVYLVFPIIEQQILSMIDAWPMYWEQILTYTEGLIYTDMFSGLVSRIQESNILNTITEQATEILTAAVGGISSIVGTAAQVFITIFTVPIILYYLIIDGKKIPFTVLRFVPTDWRKPVAEFLTSTHNQLSYYIRGQLLVAFAVAVMFWIGFAIIGLDFGLVLAIVAGVLNLVPYLGSVLASIPALIIGLVESPLMFISVIIVIAVEQFLEGRVIQPLVLGNQLNIHPITIIFILLIAGRLFGLMGIILAVPGYAILKIIVSMAFNYLHEHSDLYHEEEKQPADHDEPLIETEED